MERKKQQIEKEEVLEIDKQKIFDSYQKFWGTELESKNVESSNNRNKLENILTEYTFNLKTEYYK